MRNPIKTLTHVLRSDNRRAPHRRSRHDVTWKVTLHTTVKYRDGASTRTFTDQVVGLVVARDAARALNKATVHFVYEHENAVSAVIDRHDAVPMTPDRTGFFINFFIP